MSSLHILIVYTILRIIIADNENIYFTQSNYDIWCQENVLSNSLLLYPNRIPIGIYHTSSIKFVVYHLIDDNNNNELFSVNTKLLADFYFCILNIIRPLDINREYQDNYILRIQANIITNQGNYTEYAKIHLHVADSNDNDGVFDIDIYEKTFTEPVEPHQSLIRFHSSDADEIQHAQILYELSFNDTFSLHPYTGELYLISKNNFQSIYEFDIYAYDRHRKYFINNNIKTKAHVKLNFSLNNISHQITTIFNELIEFQQIISSYKIEFFQNTNWNILNIHQPILTIEISPPISSYEIFIRNNSSRNSIHLFLNQNQIYLNNLSFQQYNLHFLICFFNRTKCQYTNYNLVPSIDWNSFQFYFKSNQTIFLEEDLPIHSYITHIQLQYNDIISNQELNINYKLLNNHLQFNIHPKTGIVRLLKPLKYQKYFLQIQADVKISSEYYSIKTNIEINVYEINKYRPRFYNYTSIELFQLPYQFQAFDFDQNKQTNGRISYRLSNCFDDCLFQINPNNGILNLTYKNISLKGIIYYLQIIAFDWGEPISSETKIHVRIYLLSRLVKRDLGRKWKHKTISEESLYASTAKPIYLNVGFKQNSTSYHLSEDAEINTIIDYLNIEYDSSPLFINNEKENLFFYIINDTSVPFTIDQNEKTIKLINPLDREKHDQYIFEIELQLKPSYAIKFQEIYNSSFDFKYYQKLLIIIYINDINDHIPMCNYFHKHIYLNENQIQTNIFHVQAFDNDLGENGTIIYSLFNYNQYFTIHPYTGQINCIHPIDHEQIPFLLLHIIASDQGQQVQLQSICMTLHITIVDINDNIPQFSSDNYTYHLFSDLPRQTTFGQIYAFDKDSSDHLIYSIESNPYIKINEHTGHLQLQSHLHRLVHQYLNLTVKVSDGLHINQTWIYLHIKRFMEAQEPILLSEPAYGIIINQSVPIGKIVTNVYQYFQLSESSIDFIEIIHDDNQIPFSIDQQGSIRSLTDLSNSSYWVTICLTRYRAHPPHSFVHVHISIQEDNFYLPQCVDVYQNIQVYDYSIGNEFARVQGLSLYEDIQLQYSIINEKIFSINRQTGLISLLSNNHLLKSDYLLTVRALDNQHQLFVDCYLNIHFIRRRQLTPKFFYSSIYKIDLIEISTNHQRLRQRLFQVIALLDHKIYEKNLEIRYRIIDSNQYFIINRQTGYIAAKQPLYPYTTYEFDVEAFAVVHRDDIEPDGNDDDEYLNRGKWRIVSSRVVLPIKVRILPLQIIDSSLSFINESIINIDLFTTTKVGSTLLQLGTNDDRSEWFIIISHIDHTRYFHVNFQSGELILIRPIEELIKKTTMIELRINVTNDWIHMDTIKIIVHIINDKRSSIHFPRMDYYSSVSKNLPTGIEIAHLTIENSIDNCIYAIHSVERIKSKDFFYINPYSGSVTLTQSLQNSINKKHLLTIMYHCQSISQIAYARLHINILDKDKSRNSTNNSYRFSQKNYLVIFETSLINKQKKYLINLDLISNENEGRRIKPDAQIIEGDPLGLFSIDASNQSLFLLDQSQSRSYTYPIHLTVIDTSQTKPVNCTVTIFISNIGIQFTCPSQIHTYPHLLTYESKPRNSIDPLTGQQYDHYDSVIIRGFDPSTPLNIAECLINSEIKFSNKTSNFVFEKDIYYGYLMNNSTFIYNNQEPMHLSIKNRDDYSNPFDITYQFLNQSHLNSFQLDQYTGIITYNPKTTLFNKYSFLILAKYRSLIAFTRLNIFIDNPKESLYKFQVFKPLVNNYTIGYINKINSYSNVPSMFSFDTNGRLFIKNQTLISTGDNSYNFTIGKARIEINILSKGITQCSLNRFYSSIENDLIGFIEILNSNQRNSFYLLNYNHLFVLNHDNGLLRYRDPYQMITNDLILLIQVNNSRCLVNMEKDLSIPYMVVRKGMIDIKTSSGQLKVSNGTYISNQAPIFSQKSYTFSVDITNNINKTIFVGQISAQLYNKYRSYLVYQFISLMKDFIINPVNGIIEYIPNKYYNKTIERFQIIAHDLIYQQNTTINITIHIFKSEFISLSSRIYHQFISEILPPGSMIFQPNISIMQNVQFSLQDYNSNLFTINSDTGQVTLLNYLSDIFYSFKIHISPINQILIIKLTILDYNNHPPTFSNLPLNLTISSDDILVTKLSAYDLDLSDNQNLKYYLRDKDQRKIFSVNQKTGIITLKLPPNQTFFQLNIAVSDGLHLTTTYLPVTIYDYSKNSPKFSSDEYSFQYKKILGQIFAYDSDPNDQILYQLYLEPDGIQIDPYSGFITINKTLFPQPIEFFASASDRAAQIVYTKILLVFPNPPNFYEIHLEKNLLEENYCIHKFDTKNSSFKILPTSLTESSCTQNFYLKQNELYFNNYPILSNLCIFQIQLSSEKIFMKILFINSDLKPKFSSNIYHFYTNNIRVFAKSLNPIRYKLQTNPYGLIIHQADGILSFKYGLERINNFDHIQLFVYAIDEKTYLNNTATINIILNKKKQLEIPKEILLCSNTPISISDQSLPGTIIQDIHLKNNNSNHYYILSGDKYGLFAINNLGQLHLISSILNRTSDEYFELIILISSFSISYCRTNISIIRSPRWSYFICPSMPIEWMIEEESPIGTRIGNIKEILFMINNNFSQLIERIDMKLNDNPDAQAFNFNSSTGLFLSNSRLDYEQKNFYSFSIFLEPNQLNCSVSIVIKLININDNSISFDRKSLTYTINENLQIPSYIGRTCLIGLDQVFSFEYKYYLKNSSSKISIDSNTGSIILIDKLNRGKLQYEIMALNPSNQKNLTDILTININDHGPLFKKNVYQININKSIQPGTIIFQVPILIKDGNIKFYMRNSSSIFLIDKYTGDIHLNEYISSIITNLTLIIEGFEEGINITDRTNVVISVINDDYVYFKLENRNRCFIDENQSNGTRICAIGQDSNDFIYHLIDPMNLFDILSNNGTIINRKIFDYEIDKHEYYLTIVAQDRKNQSISLSSLNLTIYIRNLNDNPSKFLTENFTTLLYFFYPSLNTNLHKIEAIDKDQSNLTFEIINNTPSIYTLRSSSNSTEIILIKPILNNREDNLIIRLWENNISISHLHLRLIYLQHEIEFPTILSRTIDGYINLQGNSSPINLGQLFIQNHSQYQFIYFHLIPHKHFFLKQLSNNQTELYFKPFHQSSFIEFQIHLTAIATHKAIPKINFNNNTKIFFPSTLKHQSINIHLRPIHHEMLDRTISLIINTNPNTTYEQFIIHNLPSIRQTLAQIIGVNIHHVHIYTYELKLNQIELLIAILRSTSVRYIHKKFLYNTLKNATNIFEKISFNQCQSNSCENHAHCASHISLLNNQYRYIYSNTYQYLISKYQWNIKCSCMNSYYGERCQFKQDSQSPCSANPCLSIEKCIEESPILYSCQCMNESCNYTDIYVENSLECININSPTCRDSSNSLTFDGYSSVRMNITGLLNITLSIRTYSTTGNLLKLLYFNHSVIIQIIDGYIKVEINEKILLQLNQILINDGQWHDIYFSIDDYYYLLRLDHIFSDRIILSERIYSNNLIQLIIGTDFDGCLGNLTINNQRINLQQQKENGTNIGCQLPEIIQDYSHNDDLCSLYHPCYHGGICTNDELNFTCNCPKPRFTGHQCQLDLYPCESHPCHFNEQCTPFSSNLNKSFTCVLLVTPISISRKTYLYIGLSVTFGIDILFLLIIYYYKKRKENFNKDKRIVSSPLLIRKSSPRINQIRSSREVNYDDKQTIETRIFGTHFNDKESNHRLYESLDHCQNNSKYYSTIEQIDDPSDHFRYQTTDLLNFSSPPTHDFNIHINSLSDLTENFVGKNDNDTVLLTPLRIKRNSKRSFNQNSIHRSTLSLSKAPIYAKIVKTPKMSTIRHHRLSRPLSSTSTPFIKPIENPPLNRLRHASDSDLFNGRKLTNFSSFFQTDV